MDCSTIREIFYIKHLLYDISMRKGHEKKRMEKMYKRNVRI